MDVRGKLVELICDGTQKTEICTTDTYMDCETCRGDCGYCTILADHLIANGVTVQERLVAKQVVIDKKYKSTRCPSCNAVLGASSHYCWQCGQKVTHNLPEPPKGE